MAQYERSLSLFDGTMVVVGGIIGAGIFLNPAIVAQRADTSGMILFSWAFGGALALVGAFCFAELGSRRPEAGGGYVYLKETFGKSYGFMYGWMMLLVSNTGAIAALAVTFARYLVDLAGWDPMAIKPLAAGSIILLSGINYLGVRPGSITQNIFTVLKLLALALLVMMGLFGMESSQWALFESTTADHGSWSGFVVMIGAALIPVMFSFGGWQHANHVAGEMERPERNLPRSLIIGVTTVVIVYLLANLAYLYALGPQGLAKSLAPAADAMNQLMGSTGRVIISAGIIISTFGILNLFIMAAPRVYQAMAEDDLFFSGFAELHPKYKTPSRSILLQAGWALVLTLSGTYGQLLDYVVFGDWIFFALVVGTLFIYRSEEQEGGPDHDIFRIRAYPMLPMLFILVSIGIVISSIFSNPWNAGVGSVLILSGIPVYYWWNR